MVTVCCLSSIMGVAAFFIWSATRMYGRAAGAGAGLLIVGWLVVTAYLSTHGYLSDFRVLPPTVARLTGLTFIVTLVLALSPVGRRFVAAVPWRWVVGYQSFRVIVEVMLWRLSLAGLVPLAMTFFGRNFDFLTGVTALWFSILMSRPNLLLLRLWALIGLALLINVVIIANLSFPTPYEIFAPPFGMVASSPLIWLPTFLVPAALFGHVALLRWRLFGRASTAET